MPKGYDPYRTPPLWIEPESPLDYIHDADDDRAGRKGHERDDDSLDGRPQRPIGKPAPKLSQSSHPEGASMKFLDFLLPPVNASAEALRRWRLSISIAVMALSVSFPLAFGVLPGIPFSGFAYASDVKDIKVKLLERELFDSLVRQCSAKNDESRLFYGQKVQDLLTEYRKTAKADYQRPSCRELTGSAPAVPPERP